MTDYRAQNRGDASAYQRYLAGMDASMRQKVALTAAHLLAEGTVADMGSGSGAGSDALAALYPRLQVVGVDVSPAQIEHSTRAYHRPNLRFVVGDAAEPAFAPASLHGIFDSSMLHHVTSFNGYDRARVKRALEVQVAQLCDGGVLIVRDFVDPGPGEVLLDLRDDDGHDDDAQPLTCSTAALFRRFSRDFRLLQPAEKRGFHFVEQPPPRTGWRRFSLSRTLAAEFVLRKDYRNDWELEAQEEYTYATQTEMEAMFAGLGLRVLASTPIWNPWIVRNRFDGKIEIRSTAGVLEDHPPTNYLVVGERVAKDQGVRFEVTTSDAPPSFLQMMHHRDRISGKVLDLVRRPNDTLDVIPWFVHQGAPYVLARMSFPRPLLAHVDADEPALDGARAPHYVTEPLVVLRTDQPLALAVEEALASRAGIESQQIRGMMRGATYYPSPGGLAEEVRAVFVEIDPVFVDRPLPGVSDFSTSGRIGAIEARQLLRAAQVGGLPDARLENNTHVLLRHLGLDLGPWIGEAITLEDGPAPAAPGDLSTSPSRRRFEPTTDARGFLGLRVLDVEEIDASGAVVARGRREMVVPQQRSRHSVSCALLRKAQGEVWIALHDHDLPAAQMYTGSSRLWVAPAWRLPRGVSAKREVDAWIDERIAKEHGVEVVRSWALGGRYHPSAGATPEVVYPRAVEVRGDGRLSWVRLKALIDGLDQITDGNLRIAALRAAHALQIG